MELPDRVPTDKVPGVSTSENSENLISSSRKPSAVLSDPLEQLHITAESERIIAQCLESLREVINKSASSKANVYNTAIV